jgi:hypothetical protein
LKKRTKKLLRLGRASQAGARQHEKVFWFFFSKKNRLLSPPGDQNRQSAWKYTHPYATMVMY